MFSQDQSLLHSILQCLNIFIISNPFGGLVGRYWGSFVGRLVSTTNGSRSPDYWIQAARTEAYELCYNGCGDTSFNTSIIANACLITAKVDLSSLNITCDASKIWFWADRYPIKCLEAVGEIYKADELWWTRFRLRMLYIFWPIFRFLASFVAYMVFELVTLLVVKCVTSWKRKPRAKVGKDEAGVRIPLLRTVAVTFLALASLPNLAIAYPCASCYPPYDKFFTNTNGTLYGTIHGWLSDCHYETYACGESCTTPSVDGNVSCTPVSCTQLHPFKLPVDFVNSVVWRVEECGFVFVDVVPGVVDKRIPNPKIEELFWVKIAVNAFNSTDTGEEKLDDGVKCLYEMI